MLQRMLARLRGANDDEKGFTLIELLVVILIIGILAAIALPTFLGQQDKAKDSSAKSDARNMVSMVESCFATNSSYAQCHSEAELGSPTGLDVGTSQGQVVVTAGADADTTYKIDAYSKSGNHFFIERGANGLKTYSCTTTGKGGCPGNGNWKAPGNSA
jgi:type IV pilus assembly protein PilA